MRLNDWMKSKELNDMALAEKIGVHAMTIYRIRCGLTFPKKETIQAIMKATKGRVTANDFFGIERPPDEIGRRGRPRKKKGNGV